MAVTRGDSVAVINGHKIAVAGVRRGIDNQAVGGCGYRSAEVNGYVEPLMDFASLAVKWISSHTETIGHVTINRQAAGNRRKSENIGTQPVIDMTYLAFEMIGRFIKRRNCFGSADAHQLVDLR